MANFFKSIGKLFGMGDDKENEKGYEGVKPYSSLKDIPEGKTYVDTLNNRLAGLGVGYDPKILNEATNPYAQARRSYLTDYEIPSVANAASARGLGRSSLVTSQIGKAQQTASQDIAQKIADLQLANETQKRNEINQALAGLGEFTSAESAQRDKIAEWDYGDFKRVMNNKAANDANQQAGVGRLLTLGSSIALAPFTGGASLLSIPNTFSGGSQIDTGLSQIMNILNQRTGGTVNISGGGVSNLRNGQASYLAPSSGFGLLNRG